MNNKMGSQASILFGMAGQLRVASELLLRGFKPALGFVDTGVDLILDNGITIQVKSSHLLRVDGKKKMQPAYYFILRHWTKKGPRPLRDVNYIICWGIDTNEFWIIPRECVEGLSTMRCTPMPSRKPGGRVNRIDWPRFLGAWATLERG